MEFEIVSLIVGEDDPVSSGCVKEVQTVAEMSRLFMQRSPRVMSVLIEQPREAKPDVMVEVESRHRKLIQSDRLVPVLSQPPVDEVLVILIEQNSGDDGIQINLVIAGNLVEVTGNRRKMTNNRPHGRAGFPQSRLSGITLMGVWFDMHVKKLLTLARADTTRLLA